MQSAAPVWPPNEERIPQAAPSSVPAPYYTGPVAEVTPGTAAVAPAPYYPPPSNGGAGWSYPPPAQDPQVMTNGFPDPYWVESSAEDSKVAYHHNTATNPPKRMNSRPKSDTEVNPKYQDVWAALLFAAHLAVMAWLAFGKGLSYLKYDATHADNGGGGDNPAVNIKSDSLVKMVCGGLLSTLLAGIFSLFWLKFLIKQGEAAVKGMLYGSIAIQAMGVVASFLSGQMWLGIMGAIFLAMSVCYTYLVRSRIPFAGANLAVACSAIKKCWSVVVVSFLAMGLQAAWQLMWSLALIGAVLPTQTYRITQGGYTYSPSDCSTVSTVTASGTYGSAGHPTQQQYQCACTTAGMATTYAPGECKTPDPPAGVIFLLLVSFFWASLVIQYVNVVTTAGVVGEWWFSGTGKGSTLSALKRACSYSFGSICFGALVLSVIRATQQMLREMAKKENSTMAACAACLLGLIDQIATYFNRYAMIYVALYGGSLMESGRGAMDLFKRRGLTAIINDQLISNALMLASFTSAVVVGLLSYFYAWASVMDRTYTALVVGIGFLLGLVVCSIFMSIIDSAVATILVCWADAPEALRRVEPELYNKMADAWRQIEVSAV